MFTYILYNFLVEYVDDHAGKKAAVVKSRSKDTAEFDLLWAAMRQYDDIFAQEYTIKFIGEERKWKLFDK